MSLCLQKKPYMTLDITFNDNNEQRTKMHSFSPISINYIWTAE